MTLDEFIDECKSDADRFRASWVDGERRNPQQYPESLEPGEWYEQYLAFLSSEE